MTLSPSTKRRWDPSLGMNPSFVDPTGEAPFRKPAVFRAYRRKEFVGLQRESGGETLYRREPDFSFTTGFDLLEEVLGKVGHLGKFLLRQLVAKPQLFQTNANTIQGSHPCDRRDFNLTFLPAITWIARNQMDTTLQCISMPPLHGGQPERQGSRRQWRHNTVDRINIFFGDLGRMSGLTVADTDIGRPNRILTILPDA